MREPKSTDKCRRCGDTYDEHRFHPTKNPQRAGTRQGSRCKAWVGELQDEGGQGRPVPPEVVSN